MTNAKQKVELRQRLQLNKETLRKLQAHELRAAAAAGPEQEVGVILGRPSLHNEDFARCG